MYKQLTTPAAEEHLHFAGEALSPRHAWVEGALDSAWRAVYEILCFEPAWHHLLRKFFCNWGRNPEWWKPCPHEPCSGGGPVLGEPGKGSEREGGDREIDVDELLRDSLLLQHIAMAQPEASDRA